MTKGGTIRDDGRLMRDMYLLQGKKPSEPKGEWDLMNVVATIPGKWPTSLSRTANVL